MIRDNLFEIARNAMTGKYGDENLLTDLFAGLLRLDGALACTWFERVAGKRPEAVEVETQVSPCPDGDDTVDMRLTSRSPFRLALLMEHKVDARLGPGQLERYVAAAKKAQAAARDGTRYRVALVAPARMAIPAEVAADRDIYCAPPNRPCFLWDDVYSTVRGLHDSHPDERFPVALLRKQFLAFLKNRRLVIPQVPDGPWDLLLWNEKDGEGPTEERAQQAREQQVSFGEAWSSVDDWLTDRGFKCQRASRAAFMAWTTQISEVPRSSGIDLLAGSVSDGRKAPPEVRFANYCLEFWVDGAAAGEPIRNAIAKAETSGFPLPVNDREVDVVLQRTTHSKNRPSATYWLEADTLLQSATLADDLLAIVTGIYERSILEGWKDLRKSMAPRRT